MKILIVAPQYKPYGQFYELPLGLAYISSYLKNKGMDVEFVNTNERHSYLDKLPGCDVVCTGGLSPHYSKIKQIVADSKRINPRAVVIVGGGIISSEPDLALNMLGADIGIVGEGEEKLFDVLQGLGSIAKPSIIKADPIKDLDSLPFPDYEGMGILGYLDRQLAGDEYYLYPLKKPRCVAVISSRSCPHSCTFCFHPCGQTYRQRSLDNFFKEVEFLISKYSVNMLAIIDELFAVFPDRIREFCERMQQYNIKWMSQMRVDSVDLETLVAMKRSGCVVISYGIEHVNNDILKSFGKKTTISQVEAALDRSQEAGIGIQGNILLGDIKETDDTVMEAMSWRRRNAKFCVNIGQVTPYPGTALYKHGVETGKINPRDYIEAGCPNVALSSANLKFPVELYCGEPIEIKKTGTDQYRGQLFSMKAICPHCHETSEYNDLYLNASGSCFAQWKSYRIGCQHCNQRFDILTSHFNV
jgi:anaerobic magnesium-protoporphyrin IX monomethyl ester cyclase